MKKKADPTLPETFTLDNILSTFATDENARTFLESWIWPRGPVCPRCKQTDPLRVYLMTGASTRPGLYNCKDCRRQFTVTVGTIFEDSHIPIRKWIIGLFLMASSKKGMSSLQFQRILGLGSYRTALFMTDRIRFAMQDGGPFERKIKGHVEIDECYRGKSSLLGEVLRVGGEEPKVRLRLPSGKTLSCDTSESVARELGHRLYDFVTCAGVATWDYATGEVLRFKIEKARAFNRVPASKAFSNLAAAMPIAASKMAESGIEFAS